MRMHFFVVLCAIIVPCAWSQTKCSAGSFDNAKQQLLEEENHWLQVEDDAEALQSILAPDFLHVVPVGIITRDEQIGYMRRHPAPHSSARKHFEDVHVRVYGDVGIVNGMVVAEELSKRRRTLFTDVFICRHGKWQAISAQELPVEENTR